MAALEVLDKCFAQSLRMTKDDLRLCIDPKTTGAVRVSLGLASNFADARRFVEFAECFTSVS